MSGSAGDPVEVDVVLGEGDAGGSRLAPLGEVELQVNGYLIVQEHTGYSKQTHKHTEKCICKPKGTTGKDIFQSGLCWPVYCCYRIHSPLSNFASLHCGR